MFKINDENNNIAVWLDHRKLINKLYKTDENPCMELITELFQFNSKAMVNDECDKDIKPKARKRKATGQIEDAEILNLLNISRYFLVKLKEKNVFQSQPNSKIERFWEDDENLPKLNGGNNLKNSHIFSMNGKTYVIPPKCIFFNLDIVENVHVFDEFDTKFDFIVLDPPWKNKYIKRLKKAKTSLGYKTLENDRLSEIPLSKVIHTDSIVAIWCTNSIQHQDELLTKFLPAWNLKLITKWHWLKVNTSGEPICNFNTPNKKQPFEVLYIACNIKSERDYTDLITIKLLMSIPSIIHSHKPPVLDIFKEFLPAEPKCLELFARYLQPHFTSMGLQVLKLMDDRLYIESK